MISAVTGTIVNSTEALLRNKPRGIPRVNWDHRDWVHQRELGWVYHGWVGIVRWQHWIWIISILILKCLPFLFFILFLGIYISSENANKDLNNRNNISVQSVNDTYKGHPKAIQIRHEYCIGRKKRKFKLICSIINCSHSCSIKKQNLMIQC